MRHTHACNSGLRYIQCTKRLSGSANQIEQPTRRIFRPFRCSFPVRHEQAGGGCSTELEGFAPGCTLPRSLDEVSLERERDSTA